MKRFLSILLMLCLVLGMAACGGEEETSDIPATNNEQTQAPAATLREGQLSTVFL